MAKIDNSREGIFGSIIKSISVGDLCKLGLRLWTAAMNQSTKATERSHEATSLVLILWADWLSLGCKTLCCWCLCSTPCVFAVFTYNKSLVSAADDEIQPTLQNKYLEAWCTLVRASHLMTHRNVILCKLNAFKNTNHIHVACSFNCFHREAKMLI